MFPERKPQEHEGGDVAMAGMDGKVRASRRGFDVDAAYRWKRVLRRTGQWVEADAAPVVQRKQHVAAVRFPRVAVSDAPPVSMLLRLVLLNGRRTELEIGGVANLGEVLGVLEQAA